jgi:hypothetical protein
MNQSGEVRASAFTCLLVHAVCRRRKVRQFGDLPWTYSFLRGTLKLAICCDRPEESIGHLFTSLGTYLLLKLGYVLLCCVVVAERCGSCSGHINQVRAFWGKCTSWLAWHQEMFARVCSRKIMGPSYAPHFLATTKVPVFNYRASWTGSWQGQLLQRGYYNRWAQVSQHTPVHHVPLDAHYDSVIDEPQLS